MQIPPLTTPVDTDVLTAVEEELFENLYDVPFVTVNRIGEVIEAEVHLAGVDLIDQDRLDTAHSVAREHGFRSYARVFADLYEDSNVVHILFSDDPAKGLIWALENEMDLGVWSQ